jgi:cob(I)alamin adenosyltransferase
MARQLTRIYTRTGDGGRTSLAGGRRVSKASLTVAAGGEADELVCHLGLLRALARERAPVAAASAAVLRAIQEDLFAVGLILATPATAAAYARRAARFGRGRRARFLETRLDRFNRELAPLARFVLPGSGVLEAQAHVARAVCRRFERALVRRAAAAPVPPAVLAYVNRLSDFLFVYARWVAARLGEAEDGWTPAGR